MASCLFRLLASRRDTGGKIIQKAGVVLAVWGVRVKCWLWHDWGDWVEQKQKRSEEQVSWRGTGRRERQFDGPCCLTNRGSQCEQSTGLPLGWNAFQRLLPSPRVWKFTGMPLTKNAPSSLCADFTRTGTLTTLNRTFLLSNLPRRRIQSRLHVAFLHWTPLLIIP